MDVDGRDGEVGKGRKMGWAWETREKDGMKDGIYDERSWCEEGTGRDGV